MAYATPVCLQLCWQFWLSRLLVIVGLGVSAPGLSSCCVHVCSMVRPFNSVNARILAVGRVGVQHEHGFFPLLVQALCVVAVLQTAQ